MLWRVTVALAVICVGSTCNSVGANEIVPSDHKVILCGREFIRAVIFTCGGSRWKRSTEGESELFHQPSLDDVAPEADRRTWQHERDLRDDNSPLPFAASNSLADLLTLFTVTNERRQSSPGFPGLPSEFTALGEQEENENPANRLVATKKKRNFSQGVAGLCCTQGCTKNDIGRLC